MTKANWQDAEIVQPPDDWGGDLPGGRGQLPPGVRQIDPKTGWPRTWPMHNTIAHWAALQEDLKAGRNGIHRVQLIVDP